MNKFTATMLNFLFFGIVILLAISVATISLTKKVNEYRTQSNQNVTATVMKDVVPVLSFSRGVVTKIHVREGQEVKKGDLLVEMDNPVLRGKIDALEQYRDNVSAQTEAKVAQEELKNLAITAPFDGIVGTVLVTNGAAVDNLSKIMTIYSNENIRLLSHLSVEQYQTIRKMHEIKAYDDRLNQNFVIKPDLLKPDEKETDPAQQQTDNKKIGVYFTLADKTNASSLLHNEDLQLDLLATDKKIRRPIDYFVDFWNGLLARDTTTNNL